MNENLKKTIEELQKTNKNNQNKYEELDEQV
jgi:hypothetical protein